MSYARFVCVLAVSFLLGAPIIAEAWPIYGTRLSGDYLANRLSPIIASDGVGGAFVQWLEDRDDAMGLPIKLLYLQHVTISGDIAPGWPAEGIQLSSRTASKVTEVVAPDGHGGVIVVWQDSGGVPQGESDVYAQRVGADGQRATGWPSDGLLVCGASGGQGHSTMVADGLGGALIAWDDDRHGSDLTEPYGVHVKGDGSLAPGWPVNGRLLAGDGTYYGAQVIPDGAGVMLRSFAADGMHLFRMDFDGNLIPGWPPAGAIVLPITIAQKAYYPIIFCSDGGGGAFVVWSDFRTAPSGPAVDILPYLDLYGIHMLANGAIAPGWPVSGLPIAIADLPQQNPVAIPDGSGGLLVAWEDFRTVFTTGVQIYGAHYRGDGTLVPNWTANGQLVTDGPSYDSQPRLATDDLGGMFVSSWDAFGYDYARVQHVLSNGQLAPGFGPAGFKYAPDPTTLNQVDVGIIPDGYGGAIVAWAADDILAQHVGSSGPTPTALALVSAEAEPASVRLVWQGSASNQANVERRTDSSAWSTLASIVADGTGRLSYTDREVIGGTRYAYRLGVAVNGTDQYSTETWVDVPRAYELALAGFRPNPAISRELSVAFTLPDAKPATLDLIDVTGRRIGTRQVGTLGVGRHVVRLDNVGQVPAGMYWIRLARPERSLLTKGVVIR